MQHKRLYQIKRYNKRFLTRIFAVFLLVSLTLCGCAKKTPETDSSAANTKSSQNASTQAEPVTLEQALLKERGIPYDQSDYKKFLGGENIIHEYAEFDCNLDHGYSKSVNDLVVSDGKLYQANFNSLLANGKNIQEIGTLPGKDVRYWQLTYDGEMGSMYLKDGSGYKISAVPFSTAPLDNAKYPLFKKVYRYAADGKTLEDHTAEYLNADRVYDNGIPMIVFKDGQGQSALFGKSSR